MADRGKKRVCKANRIRWSPRNLHLEMVKSPYRKRMLGNMMAFSLRPRRFCRSKTLTGAVYQSVVTIATVMVWYRASVLLIIFTECRLQTLGNSCSKVRSNATQQLTAVEKPVTVPDKNHQSSPLLDTGTHKLGGTNLELISTDETPDTMIVDQTCTSSVLESEIPTQSDYEEEDSSVYFVHALLLHAIILILFFSRHLV